MQVTHADDQQGASRDEIMAWIAFVLPGHVYEHQALVGMRQDRQFCFPFRFIMDRVSSFAMGSSCIVYLGTGR